MKEVELYKAVQKAGAAMTNKQISKVGREVEEFGIDKDAFMLLLISGNPAFKNLILSRLSGGK